MWLGWRSEGCVGVIMKRRYIVDLGFPTSGPREGSAEHIKKLPINVDFESDLRWTRG